MTDIRSRLADALREHRIDLGPLLGCGRLSQKDCSELADVLLSQPGITILDAAAEERRVITPQGTRKPVGPDEVVGDRLRDLGWRIESRYVTDWLPVDGSDCR